MKKVEYVLSATAGSCDFEEVAEDQGLWEFKRGFLYQI